MRPGADEPVLELDHAVTACRHVHIVGGQHQREAVLVVQRGDEIENPLARVGIEVPGRLVAQQQFRPLCQRTGDRDALRLTAGELGGQRVELVPESDLGEQLCGPLGVGVFGMAGGDGDGDVLIPR